MNFDRELEAYRTRINGSPADLEDACRCEYPDDECDYCERMRAEENGDG